jgi:hypothetical protein
MSERDFHLIFPHDVDKRQCVGHWLYACCVDSSQLIEIFEDFTYLLGIQKLFLLESFSRASFATCLTVSIVITLKAPNLVVMQGAYYISYMYM